jgi:hypothetical protein
MKTSLVRAESGNAGRDSSALQRRWPAGRAISGKVTFRVAFLILSARRLINPLLDRLHRCGQLPL